MYVEYETGTIILVKLFEMPSKMYRNQQKVKKIEERHCFSTNPRTKMYKKYETLG